MSNRKPISRCRDCGHTTYDDSDCLWDGDQECPVTGDDHDVILLQCGYCLRPGEYEFDGLRLCTSCYRTLSASVPRIPLEALRDPTHPAARAERELKR